MTWETAPKALEDDWETAGWETAGEARSKPKPKLETSSIMSGLLADQLAAPGVQLQVGEQPESLSSPAPIRAATIKSLPTRFAAGAGEDVASLEYMEADVGEANLSAARETVRRMTAGWQPRRGELAQQGPVVEHFALKAAKDPEATLKELDNLLIQADRTKQIASLTGSSYAADIAEATPPDENFLEKAVGTVARSGASFVLGLAVAPISGGAAVWIGSTSAGLAATGNSYKEATEFAEKNGIELTPQQKAFTAVTDGFLEMLGERFSLKVALKAGPMIFRRYLETIGAEASSEAVTELFQTANKVVSYNDKVTLQEFLYGVALAGTAGAIGGGATGAVVHAGQKVGEKLDEWETSRKINKAVDQLLVSEDPALLTPEQEAVRLLDPKVSGRPLQTPQEAFDHLLKTDPQKAAEFALTNEEALGEEFQPIRRAKELFQAGQLSREGFIKLRQHTIELLARTTKVDEAGVAIEAAATAEEEVVKTSEEYVPTDDDLEEVTSANNVRRILERDGPESARGALLSLPPTTLVSRVIRNLMLRPESMGDIEYKQLGSPNVHEPTQWITALVKYYRQAAQRQAEGLYPFAPPQLFADEHPDPVGHLPWGQLTVRWNNQGGTGQAFDKDSLKSGQVVVSGGEAAQRWGSVVSDWIRRFSPDMRLLVMDHQAAQKVGLISPMTTLSGIAGQMAPMGQSMGIWVNANLPEEQQLEVLVHEFGHALYSHMLKKAHPAVRLAMVRAWSKDVMRKLDAPLSEVFQERRGAIHESKQQHMNRTLREAIAENGFYRSYLNNHDEWSAHMMERALGRDFKGMQELVKRFFQRYMAVLKQVWKSVFGERSEGAQTWEKFVEAHALRAKARDAHFLRYNELETELIRKGFEEITPEEAQDAQKFLLNALGKLNAPQDLIDSMVNSTPELRERAALAIRRIGEAETAILTPSKDIPVKLSAEEYTTVLQDAWLPGQDARLPANVQPKSTRFSGRVGSFVRNSLKYSRLLRGKFSLDLSEYEGHLDKFGWFSKWAYMVEHIAKVNPHIDQLQAYINHVREWARTRMAWIARADERLRKWRDLNATEQKVLGKFLLDQTQQGKFFDLNNPEIIKQYPLTPRAKEMYEGIRSDFVDFISAIEGALIQSAAKRMSHNPFAAAAEMERIKDRFSELKKQPYFPLSRFGKYLVVVRATKTIRIKGNLYQPGDVMHFEAFDTNLARMAELDKIKGMYPSGDVKLDVATESVRSLMGMPAPVIDAMKNDPNINLTAEQKKAIDEYLYRIAPGQSFTKHLIQRKGIEGYTEDVMRTYANYFFHGASHLARIQHSEVLAEDIKALDLTADLITSDASKRRAIANYMRRHFDYILNPENDWSAIRSVIAVSYLGAVMKTAMVNLTQVAMTTYPHLAAQYGDAKAIATLKRAYGDVMAMYHVTKPLTTAEEAAITRWSQGEPLQAGDEKIVKQWSKLTADERRMLRQAVLEGWIDESQAMELAAMSEGSWLTRFKATSRAGYYWRTLSHYAMVPFQAAEKVNRRVTAIAAFRLAVQNGLSYDLAYKKAREAVSATQYEYAKWNRAELLRGKKGVLFMFWQFMLNTLFFATGGDRGWWRWWGMMLATGGVMGLPFAENLMDLATWAFSREDKRVNAKYEVKKATEQLAEMLSVDSDLLLHGISRYGFGLIPFADMSGSMSMGQILPGTELLASSGTGEWSDRVAMGVKEAGGATTSLMMRMLQAVSEDDPDTLRRIERGMPVTVGQQILTAFRLYRDGANTTLSGADLTKFDVNDPWQLAEIIGKGVFGLQPRSIAKGRPEEGQPGRDETMLKQDFANFYRIRREMLLRKLNHEILHGDTESKQQVIEAIRRFNSQVPSGALRISGDTINRMRRERAKARFQIEGGQAPQRMFQDLYRQVEERKL